LHNPNAHKKHDQRCPYCHEEPYVLETREYELVAISGPAINAEQQRGHWSQPQPIDANPIKNNIILIVGEGADGLCGNEKRDV